jgi:hypothetical protein
LIDAVEYEDSDEGDSVNQEFVWEDMESYRGRRENFTSSVGPQGLTVYSFYTFTVPKIILKCSLDKDYVYLYLCER